jgi:hypothetical protein
MNVWGMTHLFETMKPIQFVQTLMADETRKAITTEYLKKTKKKKKSYIITLFIYIVSNYEYLCITP